MIRSYIDDINQILDACEERIEDFKEYPDIIQLEEKIVGLCKALESEPKSEHMVALQLVLSKIQNLSDRLKERQYDYIAMEIRNLKSRGYAAYSKVNSCDYNA